MQNKSSNLEFKISRNHILLAILIPTMFVAMFLYSIITKIEVGEDYKVEIIFAIVIIIGAGVYVYNAFKYRIVIDRETISIKRFFKTTTLYLNMIGHHKVENEVILIYDKNNEKKPRMYIFGPLEGVDIFMQWLSQYSINLELEENVKKYNEELQEIIKDKKYGKNTIEKEENFKNAKKTTSVFFIVSMISMFWMLFGSVGLWGIGGVEYICMVFVICPFVHIYSVYYFKGLIKIDVDEEKFSPYQGISYPILMTGTISFYWALSENYSLELSKMWIYGLILSFLVTILLFVVSKEYSFKKLRDYGTFIVFWLMMLFYGYGTIAFLNAYNGSSNEQEYRVQILEKRESDGDDDKTYYFKLDTWKENPLPKEIEVRGYLYKKLQAKDFVRLHLKQGNLGIKWYTISE